MIGVDNISKDDSDSDYETQKSNFSSENSQNTSKTSQSSNDINCKTTFFIIKNLTSLFSSRVKIANCC